MTLKLNAVVVVYCVKKRLLRALPPITSQDQGLQSNKESGRTNIMMDKKINANKSWTANMYKKRNTNTKTAKIQIQKYSPCSRQ